jgi:hypothetical protein
MEDTKITRREHVHEREVEYYLKAIDHSGKLS